MIVPEHEHKIRYQMYSLKHDIRNFYFKIQLGVRKEKKLGNSRPED